MKIGILATGTSPESLLEEHGSFAAMFERLFGAVDAPFVFETFEVGEQSFPDSATRCDGWLITGSKCGVADKLPWMESLKALIREIHEAGRPLLGICFGHQLVAEAFGGRVGQYSGGWGVGRHYYELVGENSLMEGEGFTLNAMHQDQVLQKPANARVLATSPFCRYAALGYGETILTLQGHPEFTLAFERALLEARRDAPIPDRRAQAGLDSLQAPGAAIDDRAVGRWMMAFLLRGRAGGGAAANG